MNIESITKFDLEAAFKALDDITVPAVSGGIKANKAPLTEIFTNKTKFDSLLEEYSADIITESQNNYTWRRGRSDGNLISIRKYNDAAKAAGLELEDPRVCAGLVSSLIRDFCEIKWQPEDNDLSINTANEVLKFSYAAEKEKLTLSQIEQVVEVLVAWFEANADNDTYLAQRQRDENKRFIARVQQDLQQVKKLDEDSIDIFVHAFETDCSFIDRYNWSYMNDLRVKVAKLSGSAAKLTEEYYDVGNQTELADAQEARDAEVAQAKLARIEKIVDLDADSPEDLLPSYVGKFIIQCPQCMTLFYKNPEDIEKSEDEPDTCNVTEVCQHCGNETGYMLIGKVGEATEDEVAEVATYAAEEEGQENLELDIPADESEEATNTGADEIDLEDIDLDEIDLEIEDDETESNESLNAVSYSNALHEQLNEGTGDDLDISDAEFEMLINSPEFKKPITTADVRNILDADDDQGTAKKKDQVTEQADALDEGIFDKLKGNIKDRVDTFVDKWATKFKTREEKADFILANAIKEGGVAEIGSDDQLIITDDNKRFKAFVVLCFAEQYSTGKLITIAPKHISPDLVLGAKPVIKENYKQADQIAKGWSMKNGNGPAMIFLANDADDTEAVFLCEYFKGELGNTDHIDKYFKSVRDDLKAGKLMAAGGMEPAEESLSVVMSSIDNLNENLLESLITESLIEHLDNVANFRIIDCNYINEQLTINGKIYLTSGESHPTSYVFNTVKRLNNDYTFSGLNESFDVHRNIAITGTIDNTKTFITKAIFNNR